MWRAARPDAELVLKEEGARASLCRYFNVMQNNTQAKFLIAKRLPAQFRKSDSTQRLWRLHKSLLRDFSNLQEQIDSNSTSLKGLEEPVQSFLDLKVEIANRVLGNCHFCTRGCHINRKMGQLGYCKCGHEIVVSSMFQHIGEEPELVPSGTVFTLGCTMRCLHCQNWRISQWLEQGEVYSPKSLASAVEHLRLRGCRNANLVGGDPTPWLAQWLETFKQVKVNVPVVWNSNTYYSEEAAKLLAGFADIYLLDFKYGNNRCASKISDAPRYWEACTRNHLHGKRHGELITRVLVLPNHLDCCEKAIVKWIARRLGPETRTNLMFQYRPEWRAHEIPKLARRLTDSERKKAARIAMEAGLRNLTS